MKKMKTNGLKRFKVAIFENVEVLAGPWRTRTTPVIRYRIVYANTTEEAVAKLEKLNIVVAKHIKPEEVTNEQISSS